MALEGSTTPTDTVVKIVNVVMKATDPIDTSPFSVTGDRLSESTTGGMIEAISLCTALEG